MIFAASCRVTAEPMPKPWKSGMTTSLCCRTVWTLLPGMARVESKATARSPRKNTHAWQFPLKLAPPR